MVGLHEAIVLQQLQYLCKNPKCGEVDENGDRWVYNSYQEWRAQFFPFWSEKTIADLFRTIEEMGLIKSDQKLRGSGDMRKFYTVSSAAFALLNTERLSHLEDSSTCPPSGTFFHTHLEDSSRSARVRSIKSITEKTNKEDITPTPLEKPTIHQTVIEYPDLNPSTTASGEAKPKAKSIVGNGGGSLVTRKMSELAKARYRLCRMFNRKPSLPWSAKEEAALKKVVGTDEADWLALEEYYRHRGEDGFYCRTSIITLLNNWGNDITRAHGGMASPKHNEEDLSRYMAGAPRNEYRQR